jgi:hypothetical protein
MKKILLACAACAALVTAAPAQELPKLSSFLSMCYRDSTTCRAKLRDYINAADTQKSICRPADQSVSEAVGDMLSWLRSDDKHDASITDAPYDDAFWAAASTLWPCTQPEPVPEPQPAPENQPAPSGQ